MALSGNQFTASRPSGPGGRYEPFTPKEPRLFVFEPGTIYEVFILEEKLDRWYRRLIQFTGTTFEDVNGTVKEL